MGEKNDIIFVNGSQSIGRGCRKNRKRKKLNAPEKLCAQSESRNNRENPGETREARHNLNADPNQQTLHLIEISGLISNSLILGVYFARY